MACYHPLPAARADNGSVRLHPPLGSADLMLPCGRCVGCRVAKATEWARRCTHEARYHAHNVFVTLTVAGEVRELSVRDVQKGLKRIRKEFGAFRYLLCGEYGARTGRAHYHAIMFGLHVDDLVRVGATLYDSPRLARAWQLGHVRVGPFSPRAASYVAQYTVKKGRCAVDEDGCLLRAPFLLSSRRPGIGRRFVEEFATDLQHGYVVADGRKWPVPRYYRRVLEAVAPAVAEAGDMSRAARPKRPVDAEELAAAERIHLSRVRQRSL